jgi:maltose alpha-D-glucosyltransferase/alpha-amylase
VQKEEVYSLLPFADQWAHYMSGFFVKAYLDKVQHTAFIPEQKEDFEVLLQTFLLERALQYFNMDIKNNPEQVIVPLRIIQSILKQESVSGTNKTAATIQL